MKKREKIKRKIKSILRRVLGTGTEEKQARKRKKVVKFVARKVIGIETEETRLTDSYKNRTDTETSYSLYLQLLKQMEMKRTKHKETK
ncbi:hypothetical protein WA1_15175 [Scytonema hofmannii PCC 7110]|uniref:Uncharacterized protein n=1 Tax=Scytonema hofmannii PCC 7110 TaxID=128403 RepID=A0A139XDK3_9CYAN|nr:hypothetical protein [Scytonema hofmannii]KYC42682.1 hypothetical protein WA1_15175 [Scytonema hofmannii PCC 7110]